ncbi:nucleotide exchange factor GrpE [Patescibacteria group bacterium]|nr:nucleotide exchange factor GrpE [Patescibacteria group bacterium]
MADQEIKKLKEKLKQAEKLAQEYLSGWQRAKADYINQEKETDRQKIAWVKFANLELILNLLSILDSFDQSAENVTNNLKNDQWVKGVLKIKEQLESFLQSQGVEKIKTKGEKFNPEFHEVIEKKGDGQEIIKQVQAGYQMRDQVIRPAKVIIK